MSFLTTQPEELAAAAGKLAAIGSAMTAQNAASAAPTTTGVFPAAADEVSALQASLFTAYGTLYQQVSAEATALYEMFVNTLQVSAGTYAATEAANSSAAASPLSGLSSILAAAPGQIPSWLSNLANIVNIGVGNWGSAASDLLALTGGGLVATEVGNEVAAVEAVEGAATAAGGAAALGQAPFAAGLGQASSIGAVAAPPSWVGPAASGTGAGVLQGAGWTAAAPEAGRVTALPGAPALASGTRTRAGFGAPRYGIKPIVMPKPAAV
ncbi:PE domain-containing protein [Mycobacterium shinjukuense]|uniref:PE family protein n=1 Tax=Mycobacterium shinjukuense TaxID=398694 RepID=A0A7I7MSI7_9MYCO|nr:PE domain-containing protein [Mycobacterium shinjukuense]MCV6984260.1 PE domain-containing protein [Mycobacterium shinjukuense]ORB65874.1 PE family protein [Mycobacterium shinjukuense]BBX74219.1 PE family protein [Mycobacterium shinjukuense]